MQALDDTLSKTRQTLIEGLKDGRLARSGQFMVVKDLSLGRELEDGREHCLAQLNRVLALAGLPQI
ncbi:MAG: hypothetical protein C0421_15595 [Hyphomonas sp.]|nr:hypothetical protein [Hyphomonas sp.]